MAFLFSDKIKEFSHTGPNNVPEMNNNIRNIETGNHRICNTFAPEKVF